MSGAAHLEILWGTFLNQVLVTRRSRYFTAKVISGRLTRFLRILVVHLVLTKNLEHVRSGSPSRRFRSRPAEMAAAKAMKEMMDQLMGATRCAPHRVNPAKGAGTARVVFWRE